MRQFSAILLLFFFAAAATAQTVLPCDTALTKKQERAFEKFRKKDGKDRYRLFNDEIRPFLPATKFKLLSPQTMMAYPDSVSCRMTDRQLFRLLGKPAVDEGLRIEYRLGPDFCSAHFSRMDDGAVFFTAYVNCGN